MLFLHEGHARDADIVGLRGTIDIGWALNLDEDVDVIRLVRVVLVVVLA